VGLRTRKVRYFLTLLFPGSIKMKFALKPRLKDATRKHTNMIHYYVFTLCIDCKECTKKTHLTLYQKGKTK